MAKYLNQFQKNRLFFIIIFFLYFQPHAGRDGVVRINYYFTLFLSTEKQK